MRAARLRSPRRNQDDFFDVDVDVDEMHEEEEPSDDFICWCCWVRGLACDICTLNVDDVDVDADVVLDVDVDDAISSNPV